MVGGIIKLSSRVVNSSINVAVSEIIITLVKEGMKKLIISTVPRNPPIEPSSVFSPHILCLPKPMPITVEKLSLKASTRTDRKTILGVKNTSERNTPIRKFITPSPGRTFFLSNFLMSQFRNSIFFPFNIASEVIVPIINSVPKSISEVL